MEVDGDGFYQRMAEEPFKGVEIRTMVKHMGSKGVPEDMDPTPPGDAGFFCLYKELVRRGRTDMLLPASSRKQPFPGLILTPVFSEFREKGPGENRVVFFSPFALLNPDHHPGGIALNMFRPEPNDLTESQTGAVGGLEQHPVLHVAGGLKKPFDLLLEEDIGELFDPGARRHIKSGLVPM